MIQSKWKRNQFKLNANINTNYCVSSATDHFKNQTREGAAVMRALLESAYAIHMFALFHLVPRIKWEWNLWKLNFCMSGWRNSEIKNETFSIVCRRTPQDFEFGHFTLLFHKERQSNVSKWKIHVRGEVISRCYFMKWKMHERGVHRVRKSLFLFVKYANQGISFMWECHIWQISDVRVAINVIFA